MEHDLQRLFGDIAELMDIDVHLHIVFASTEKAYKGKRIAV
jgi:hypothetical protein